jgi:hypothetical protein
MYWLGPHPRVRISDPKLVKVIMTNSTGAFDKAGSGGNNPLTRQLIGDGLLGLTGEKWVCHHRVIAWHLRHPSTWRVKVRTSLHVTFPDMEFAKKIKLMAYHI